GPRAAGASGLVWFFERLIRGQRDLRAGDSRASVAARQAGRPGQRDVRTGSVLHRGFRPAAPAGAERHLRRPLRRRDPARGQRAFGDRLRPRCASAGVRRGRPRERLHALPPTALCLEDQRAEQVGPGPSRAALLRRRRGPQRAGPARAPGGLLDQAHSLLLGYTYALAPASACTATPTSPARWTWGRWDTAPRRAWAGSSPAT